MLLLLAEGLLLPEGCSFGWGLYFMLLVLIIVGLFVIAGSIWADYKWRRWMDGRRRDRQ